LDPCARFTRAFFILPLEMQSMPPQKKRSEIHPVIVYPRDLEVRYSITSATRWRWEKTGKLPARDVFIGGVAEGWRPETLDSADRGEIVAA
jgi:hypothetical protein